MTFAEKLRYYRQKAGKSRREVALAIDVTPFAVKAWELGQAGPNRHNFRALRDYFGLVTDESLEGDTEPKPQAIPA